MTYGDADYRLVLDTSAVAAYAAGSLNLGEVLSEIADEPGALVAVPLVALVEAHAAVKDPAPLEVLVGLPYVYVQPLDEVAVGDWRRYANTTLVLGGLDRACAALMVVYGRAQFVATVDPDGYPGIETVGI